MKKLLKLLALAVLITTAFASCSKDQSSMSIADISGKAKIMGNLSYDAGQSYSNGKYSQLIKPAANVKVTVKVSNASLSPNGNAQGYTSYEVTTNENGDYEIEVPAVDKNNGTTVKIIAESFFGTYREVVSVSSGTPKFDEQEVLFKLDNKTESVTPGDIIVYDAQYTKEGRNKLEPYEYTSTFIVKVGEARYKADNTAVTVTKTYKTVSGKNVIVTIDGENYGATTNSSGEAQFIIPSKYQKWEASAKVEVEGYVTSNFAYYVREYNVINKYSIEGGIYQANTNDTYHTIKFSGIKNAPAPVIKVRMIFHPYDNVETYSYSANSWSNISWSDNNNY